MSWLSQATGIHISTHGVSVDTKQVGGLLGHIPLVGGVLQSAVNAIGNQGKQVIADTQQDIQNRANAAQGAVTVANAAATIAGNPVLLVGVIILAVVLIKGRK